MRRLNNIETSVEDYNKLRLQYETTLGQAKKDLTRKLSQEISKRWDEIEEIDIDTSTIEIKEMDHLFHKLIEDRHKAFCLLLRRHR